ncbi:hypothetical protein BDW69DRAFT_171699, partial [Aspergillus filifer]
MYRKAMIAVSLPVCHVNWRPAGLPLKESCLGDRSHNPQGHNSQSQLSNSRLHPRFVASVDGGFFSRALPSPLDLWLNFAESGFWIDIDHGQNSVGKRKILVV